MALAVLIGVLAILVVAFPVLMAFYLLVLALGDVYALPCALLGTAFGCLVLLVTDMVLLVARPGAEIARAARPERGRLVHLDIRF